jgi:hypothetical protein
MAVNTPAIKLNEPIYRILKTYFNGRLMAKDLLQAITSESAPLAVSQKALGIAIETLDASQYRHVDSAPDCLTAYQKSNRIINLPRRFVDCKPVRTGPT